MDKGPLRILHVIPAVAPRYGGPSELVIGTCRQLDRRGHQTTIVTSDADGQGVLPVRHDATVDYQGVATRFFPRRWSESFKIAPGMGAWLRDNIGEFDVAHLHAVFSWSTLVAGRICHAGNLPYIVRPLGSLDPWSMSQRYQAKRLLMSLGLRAVLERAAAVHYTSELEREAAESSLGLSNGRVIANAVALPEDYRRPDLESNPRLDSYLLYLGRLHPKKKLEWVISSFAAVSETSFHLIIAGDGESRYRESLERLAAESGAAGRITFTGWVSGAQKETLLRGCEALVLVSESENFGISAVEAMARGRPVLVNHGVNLHPEIRRHGAGWVVGSKHSALTSTMAEVIRRRSERVARGGRARRLAERLYGWTVVIEALEALYRQCVGDVGR